MKRYQISLVRLCFRRGFANDAAFVRSDAPLSISKPSRVRLDTIGLRGRYFTKSHEWFQVEDEGVGIVGITQAAQRALGEVVFCRLPREGERVKVMDTLASLEGLKTVAEVKSPIAGEVMEVNPRLQREPGLVTFSPLKDGWLVRLAFSGNIPRYLQRSGAVARSEVEAIITDVTALTQFLRERLIAKPLDDGNDGLEELTFDGLRPMERQYLHSAAGHLGLFTSSFGSGPGRQLVIRRIPFPKDDEPEDDDQAEDDQVATKSFENRRGSGQRSRFALNRR